MLAVFKWYFQIYFYYSVPPFSQTSNLSRVQLILFLKKTERYFRATYFKNRVEKK